MLKKDAEMSTLKARVKQYSTLLPLPDMDALAFHILVLFATNESIDQRADQAAYDRGDPEEPKLGNRPISYEYCNTGAPCRVHGSVGNRDAD